MINKLSVEQFKLLKPAEKVNYFKVIMSEAKSNYVSQYRVRGGTTQGNAFLWVSLYGKCPISRAFRSFVKNNHDRRIMNNYRGTKRAWYFGSQSDVGMWDGLRGMCEVLNVYGIECLVCDEWD